MPNATTIFRVEVVGQVYKTTRLRIPLEEYQPCLRVLHRSGPACTQHLVHLPEVHSQTVQPTEVSPQVEGQDAKVEVVETKLYGRATWNPPS